MPETLKSFFSPQIVQQIADDIRRVWPPFEHQAFVHDCVTGLDSLELTGRGRHIML